MPRRILSNCEKFSGDTVLTDIAQLTTEQIASLQELETKLLREYDTDVLRKMVLRATIQSMLQTNIYRGLVGWGRRHEA